MSRTYVQRAATSDLSTQSGINDRKLLEGTEGSGSITRSVPHSTTNEATVAWYTESSEPNLTIWAAGTYTCEVNVTSAGASLDYAVSFRRLNSSGTLQEDFGTTAEQSGTGVKTFSLSVAEKTVSAGDRLAVVLLVDNSSGSAESLTIGTGTADCEVTVPWDVAVPTVTDVTSTFANLTYGIGSIIPIVITFSEAVTVTGTPQITLETGASDAVVNYSSGSGSSTLVFQYTVLSGHFNNDLDYVATTSLVLNGGTIKDGAGNAATLTLPSPGAAGSLGANKNIAVDGVVPTVSNVTSSTANGTYGIGAIIAIQVVFSEIVTVTGTPQLTLETGASDAVVNYSSGSGSTTLVFNYTIASGHTSGDLDYVGTSSLALNGGTIVDGALPSNAATLTLASPGAAGSLGANKAIVVDGTPPTVTNVTSTAANGTYGVGALIPITITFTEVVTVTGTPQLTLETGSSDGTADYASGSGSTILTFNYTVGSGHESSDLDYLSTSALGLNSGTIVDAGSNAATLTLPTPGAAGSLGANKAIVINGDNIAPNAIIDLIAISPTTTTISLRWTAPGDNGSTGTADNYDVRYSTNPITTNALFAVATIALGVQSPSVAGTIEDFIVTGLTNSTTYYFAIRTYDDNGNLSDLSNSPSATTLGSNEHIVSSDVVNNPNSARQVTVDDAPLTAVPHEGIDELIVLVEVTGTPATGFVYTDKRILSKDYQRIEWDYYRVGGGGAFRLLLRSDFPELSDAVENGWEVHVRIRQQKNTNKVAFTDGISVTPVTLSDTDYITWYRGVIRSATYDQSGSERIVDVRGWGYIEQLNKIFVQKKYPKLLTVREIVEDILVHYITPYSRVIRQPSSFDPTNFGLDQSIYQTQGELHFETTAFRALKTLAELQGNIEFGVDAERRFYWKQTTTTIGHNFFLDRDGVHSRSGGRTNQMVNQIKVEGTHCGPREHLTIRGDVTDITRRGLYETAMETPPLSHVIDASRWADNIIADKKGRQDWRVIEWQGVVKRLENTHPILQVQYRDSGDISNFTQYKVTKIHYIKGGFRGRGELREIGRTRQNEMMDQFVLRAQVTLGNHPKSLEDELNTLNEQVEAMKSKWKQYRYPKDLTSGIDVTSYCPHPIDVSGKVPGEIKHYHPIDITNLNLPYRDITNFDVTNDPVEIWDLTNPRGVLLTWLDKQWTKVAIHRTFNTLPTRGKYIGETVTVITDMTNCQFGNDYRWTGIAWEQVVFGSGSGGGGVSLSDSVPTTIQPDDTASAGVGGTASRYDHRHAITTAVATAAKIDDVAAEGAATSFSRSDHVHSVAAGSVVDITNLNNEGTAVTFARSNHRHRGILSVGLKGQSAVYGHIDITNDSSVNVINTGNTFEFRATSSPSIGIPVDITNANAEGSASTYSRSDHRHKGILSAGITGQEAVYGHFDITNSGPIRITKSGNTFVFGAVVPLGDFVYVFTGPINISQNTFIPVLTRRDSSSANRLDVYLRSAPTGSSATFTAKKDGSSFGVVTVPAGGLSGSTVLSPEVTLEAGSLITWEITSIGSISPGTTATMIVRTSGSVGSTALPGVERQSIEAISQTVPNTTSETTTFTKTVTANSMGSDRALRMSMPYRLASTVTPTCTIRVKFGGTTIATFVNNPQGGDATAFSRGYLEVFIANKTQTSQRIWARNSFDRSYATDSGTAITTGGAALQEYEVFNSSSINTAQDQTLSITAEWSSAPNRDPSFDMLYGVVEVIK